MSLVNHSASDVAAKLNARQIVLVDVREPNEYGAERIHGALNFPLSTFDPSMLPNDDTRPLVFHCGSGIRSAKAVSACEAAGLPYNAHMQGGIQAWKAAGLPTVMVDPATGRIVDRR